MVPSDVTLKRYSDGQTVVVMISNTSPKRIMVGTVDPNYEKERGAIVKGKGWYFYNEKDLDHALKAGDYVKDSAGYRQGDRAYVRMTYVDSNCIRLDCYTVPQRHETRCCPT